MEVLIVLIPVSVLLIGLAVRSFFWAAENKQFDDLDTEASRILFDEDAQ